MCCAEEKTIAKEQYVSKLLTRTVEKNGWKNKPEKLHREIEDEMIHV